MTRNVVLITVDSLRADHCGFMGYEEDTTPKFDSRVDEYVRFESAVSPGTGTAYSMPVAFTGVDTITEVERFDSHRAWLRWHMDEFRSLPEWFSERGYTTIGFTPNPYTSRRFGFHRGFDYFEDFFGDDRPFDLRGAIASRWADEGNVGAIRLGLNMVGLGDVSRSWEQYYDAIVDPVRDATEPFFLWVFLLEPHWPYRPPSRYREPSRLAMYRHNWRRSNASSTDPGRGSTETLRSLYDGTIQHVDEFVDRLERDLAGSDPAFVLHGDHGEAFGEHGTYGHGPSVYEENIRVPLVLWNTGESGTVESPVSLASLPTILADVVNGRPVTDGSDRSRVACATAVDEAGQPTVTAEARRWQSVKLQRSSDETVVYSLDGTPEEETPVASTSRESALDELFQTPPSERELITREAKAYTQRSNA